MSTELSLDAFCKYASRAAPALRLTSFFMAFRCNFSSSCLCAARCAAISACRRSSSSLRRRASRSSAAEAAGATLFLRTRVSGEGDPASDAESPSGTRGAGPVASDVGPVPFEKALDGRLRPERLPGGAVAAPAMLLCRRERGARDLSPRRPPPDPGLSAPARTTLGGRMRTSIDARAHASASQGGGASIGSHDRFSSALCDVKPGCRAT